MRYTIYHIYVDTESDSSDSGFMRGLNGSGYSLSEAVALIMERANYAIGDEGTMTINGQGHRGIMESDDMEFRVMVTTDHSREQWSICGE